MFIFFYCLPTTLPKRHSRMGGAVTEWDCCKEGRGTYEDI